MNFFFSRICNLSPPAIRHGRVTSFCLRAFNRVTGHFESIILTEISQISLYFCVGALIKSLKAVFWKEIKSHKFWDQNSVNYSTGEGVFIKSYN